jgi:hypothetical protein
VKRRPTGHDRRELDELGRPKRYPTDRVCTRCRKVVLSIYNGTDLCWCCEQITYDEKLERRARGKA